MARILVVDDERSMREMLEIALGSRGYEVGLADSAPAGLRALEAQPPDILLTDMRLGRTSGMELLRAVKARLPSIEVIVMTAFSTDEDRLLAMKLGAYDYFAKSAPFQHDELLLLIQKALEKRVLTQDNLLLRERLGERGALHGLVGRSAAMQTVLGLIEKVAPSRTTVLITGESGTGKELVARALHQRSPRAQAPFVPVNCGAIPEGLIESELFGHVKGAFTGAQSSRGGLFAAASDGTLFLDEVGELPLGLQVKLLRALQERRIRAVGANEDVEVDVRLLAATNRNLEADVRAGRFREDLFYRLNVIQVRVPALRERRGDVLLLAEHFLRRFGAEHGRGALRLSLEARRRLEAHDFPGNVRELENLIERAVTLSEGAEISVDAFPPSLRAPADAAAFATGGPLAAGFSIEAHLALIEKSFYERALAQAGGVKKNAAALLGLTFRQFRHRYKKLFDAAGAGSSSDDGLDDEFETG